MKCKAYGEENGCAGESRQSRGRGCGGLLHLGGMALTAFADPEPAGDQGLAAGSAVLTVQADGDVTYTERCWSEIARTARAESVAHARPSQVARAESGHMRSRPRCPMRKGGHA